MTASRLATYVAGVPEVAERLGARRALWQVRDVGGAAPNHVFIVESPNGGVCAKQVLPGTLFEQDDWPLPPERATFEEAALSLLGRFAPGRVPQVLHFDSEQYLIVMERLQPHVVLRDALIRGETFPAFGEQIAEFLARSLFFTSDFGMPAAEKKERIAFFLANVEACRLSEELVFTEPFTESPHNRWTSPELDDVVAEIRRDDDLKRTVAALKLKHMASPQALLHGQLETSAIMVTQSDTRVIDPAFAFFGPIGFDVGTLIGSLLVAYFSQDGHAAAGASRDACEAWLLATIETIWNRFRERFARLWREEQAGAAYPVELFEGPGGRDSLSTAQDELMRQLLEDTLRFAGAAMIRRTIGRAPALELERIQDRDRRAACERRVLVLARELVKDAHYVDDVAEVTAAARQLAVPAPA